MAAHIRVERRRRRLQVIPRPRLFRDRSNPLEDLPEVEIFRRFRFLPDTIYFIMSILPDLSASTGRNLPIPPLLQLLVTLRFLTTGAFHILVGDTLNISRATAGRCIRRVTSALASLARRFIQFPTGIQAVSTKAAFAKVAGFPNVLGCIDCTLIRIQRPTQIEGDYINRKGYHSLNVQMCCDPKYRVTSLNASWPLSVHDSRIFRSSELCFQFERGNHEGLLLGDSGHPCRAFLLVPFLRPSNRAEERYNTALCRTRVIIEHTFGILKRRFSLLHVEMRTTPETSIIHIVACVMLHNIGINKGDIIPVDPEDGNLEYDPPCLEVRAEGDAMRDHIVRTFFS